jgi:hypothetical protein
MYRDLNAVFETLDSERARMSGPQRQQIREGRIP